MDTLNIVTSIVPVAYLVFLLWASRREPLWPRTDGEASFDFRPVRGPFRSEASFGPTAGDANQSGGE